MLRIFSGVTVCAILATHLPSKALGDTLAERLFEFLKALGADDVLYTTKASYPQGASRVNCVMRTKTVGGNTAADNTVVRLCMQTKTNSPRLQPYPMKISYRRTNNGDDVTERWSSGENTLTIHYVGNTCVVYSVKKKKPLTPGEKACGIWHKNIRYPLPNEDERQETATQVCGDEWRLISTSNKCARVPTPECKYYEDT
ncbi:uncharacterized protein LOC115320295 [Ixodes scapularis]|uniref:uncharacterized protein LOC115320295 n=1 Tax=Ixodes scapularis TaxID=6945 RepID=UPI001C38EADB|nr:uncharacterized protein LOC115320295 [Ixodes scapularis]